MAGFSLGDLAAQLTQQTSRLAARQAKEQEAAVRRVQLTEIANRESAGIQTEAMDSRQQTRDQQLQIYGSMDETLRIAQEGMKLSDSQNPMDRMRLWLLQQSDPRYTAEGNTRRLQYLAGASAAIGDRNMINQKAFADQLDEVSRSLTLQTMGDENELALLKIAEAQGAESIQAVVDSENTKRLALGAHEAIQDTLLNNMTDEQVASAATAALNAENKVLNVGGAELTAGKLEAEMANRENRAFVRKNYEANKINFALADLGIEGAQIKMAEASSAPDGYAMVGNGAAAVKVSRARLEAHLQDLTSKDIAVRAQVIQYQELGRTLQEQMADRWLETQNNVSLDDVIRKGGVIDELGGMKVPVAKVMQLKEAKAAYASQSRQQQMAAATAGDPTHTAVRQSQYIDSLIANSGAGSPLAKQLEASRTKLNIGLAVALQGKELNAKVPGLGDGHLMDFETSTLATRLEVEAMVDAEAERLGTGDKFRTQVYKHKLRGQPVPFELVADEVSNRMKSSSANKSLAGILSPTAAGVFQNAYRANYAQLVSDAMGRDGMTALTMGAMQAQLHDEAMSKSWAQLKSHLAAPMTEEMLRFQTDATIPNNTNPVVGKLTPDRFVQMQAQADQEATKIFQARTGSDEKTMQALVSGAQTSQDFDELRGALLITKLDQVAPNLGGQYVNWWSSPDRRGMVESFTAAKTAIAARQNMTDMVENAIISPDIEPTANVYAALLQSAMDKRVSNVLAEERMTYVNFGTNPVHKQLFLLNADATLSDSEKRTAMESIIMPIIQGLDTEGKSRTQIDNALESALRLARPDDPALRSLVNKLVKNRDGSLRMLNNFVGANIIARSEDVWVKDWYSPFSRPKNADPVTDNLMKRVVSGYEWWQPRTD
jgi:hypothetical protein